MEYDQLPFSFLAEEFSRLALVPGALGGLSNTTYPRREIRQVRLGAQSTGRTFKTPSPC